MKRDSRKRERRKKKTQKRKEIKRLKKYNSKKEEFLTIDHIVRARLRMLFACVHV